MIILKHFSSTELQREPTKVFDEVVNKGPVTIRSQNREDMVLVTAQSFYALFDDGDDDAKK